MGTVAKFTNTFDVVLSDNDLSWLMRFLKNGCYRPLMSQSKTQTTSFKDQVDEKLPTGQLLNHLSVCSAAEQPDEQVDT